MIRLEEVCVRYAAGTALHPTSVELIQGECTVLLGHSGAGKSTLLRCINLLTAPSSGTVRISGIGPLNDRQSIEKHRRNTAMIFQQHQLIGRHTALQNVMVGRLGCHGTLRSLFPLSKQEQYLGLESLERVGLLDRALERVDRLSGGEQQRVGVARMLVQKPRIILADEPVASLDPATARRIMGLLREICTEEQLTAVVSLHQVEIARTVADRIIGLKAGRIIFDGRPAELTESVARTLYNVTGSNGRTLDGPIVLPGELVPAAIGCIQ
ncbi:MAG: phosphonate ABC transporter ATP-binding protein [Syntrophales bacterium]